MDLASRWRTLLIRMALVVLAGASMGLVANSVHPMGLPLSLREVEHPGIPAWVWERVDRIAVDDAREMWQAGVTVLDVRDAEDYATGHIPGALSLPYQEFDDAYERVAPQLDPAEPVLIYCYGSSCGLSMRVAKLLLPRGYDRLHSLESGIAGWEKAELPVTAELESEGSP